MIVEIKANILKDSINEFGDRLTTFKLTYPRIILSEINTHRVFSKNTASSRAIPISSNIERVKIDPFIPLEWVKNGKGMWSLDNLDNDEIITTVKQLWLEASQISCSIATELDKYKLHKQYANRLLEPFMYVDTILTGTDFNNFFFLRTNHDAQPEIQRLANLMYDKYSKSVPNLVKEGEWHLPYIKTKVNNNLVQYYLEDELLNLNDAIKISISCCAQVSYRKENTSLEKAISLFETLVGGDRKHSSPLEHIATPFSKKEYNSRLNCIELMKNELTDDISNIDLSQFLYKRNLKGWSSYRTIIPNDTYTQKFVK